MFSEAEPRGTLRGVPRGCSGVPGFRTYRLADTLCSPQVLLKNKQTNKQTNTILTSLKFKGKIIFN